MGEIKNPAPVLPTPERDIHGKPLRKSFYSTVSLSDAKKKAEEFRVASEVSARTGEAFVPSTGRFAPWARKWLLSYVQLEAVLRLSGNVAYLGCVSHVAQQAVKKTCLLYTSPSPRD